MSEGKHTPGPWSRDWIYGGIRHLNKNVDYDAFCGTETLEKIDAGGLNYPNVRINPADADLIAASPDHALLLAAMAKGAVRWEPFNLNARYPETDPARGELVVDGMRYTTRLDEFGCPEMNDTLRAALRRLP